MKSNSFQMFLKRIDSASARFTPVESTISDFLLNFNSLEPIIELGISGISEKCFASKASVSRFFKTLGYKSFNEFQYMAESEKEIIEQKVELNENDTFRKLYNNYLTMLEKQGEILDFSAVEEIVENIVAAKNIYVLGLGQSSFQASRFAYRLTRFGLNAFSVTDSDEIILGSMQLEKDDFYILISVSGNSPAIVIASKQLKESNNKFALISQFSGSPAGKNSSLQVLFPVSEGFNPSDDISCMFLIDLILSYLTELNDDFRKTNIRTHSKFKNIQKNYNTIINQ